jgi:CRP/FNR family cyclic AMP-dependent transcriptional regulator
MNSPASEPDPSVAGLDPEHLRVLLGLSRLVEFAAGASVFREGAPADRLWVVHHGLVQLHTHVPGRGDVPIDTVGAGDLLGWSWMTAPYQWHFAATALSASLAHEIDAAALRESSEADPVFGYAVACALSGALLDRLQATRARLLDLYATPEAGSQRTTAASR